MVKCKKEGDKYTAASLESYSSSCYIWNFWPGYMTIMLDKALVALKGERNCLTSSTMRLQMASPPLHRVKYPDSAWRWKLFGL